MISSLAQDCIFRPIQFVVTKWDLLTGHDLAEIRRFLVTHPQFMKIVQQRRAARRPTYLIPVSAVGDRFARYDPITRAMAKQPLSAPEPYNLDLTLSLAISDTLLNSFKAALNGRDLFWLRLLKFIVGSGQAIKWVAKTGTIIMEDPWVRGMMFALDRVSERITKTAHRFEGDINARLSKIKDHNSALDNVIEIQQFKVIEFLSRFPAANLSRRMGEKRDGLAISFFSWLRARISICRLPAGVWRRASNGCIPTAGWTFGSPPDKLPRDDKIRRSRSW